MIEFKYKAKKKSGELTEGTLFANNQIEAVNRLAELNLFPIEIEKTESAPSKDQTNKKSQFSKEIDFKSFVRKLGKNKISSKELLVFTQKLATLSRAKMELLPSLKILYNQLDDPHFKEIILKVYNEVKNGQAFSKALSKFSQVFPYFYISLIKAGEASGNMAHALGQLTDFMQTKEGLKNKVIGALIYPSILVCVGIVSIFVILNFVIPKLEGIFAELGADIPLVTKIILKISEFSSKNWQWVVLIISAIVLILVKKANKLFGNFSRRLGTHIPVVNRLLKNQELASFSRSLSLLIRSGVSPLESIEISSLSIDNKNVQDELKKVADKIKNGKSISQSMKGFKNLPDFFIQMIAIGEESGRLDEVLEEVSISYTQQIDSDIAIITSVLEPVLILVLGLILGAIVVSILLPIFQVTQMVQ